MKGREYILCRNLRCVFRWLAFCQATWLKSGSFSPSTLGSSFSSSASDPLILNSGAASLIIYTKKERMTGRQAGRQTNKKKGKKRQWEIWSSHLVIWNVVFRSLSTEPGVKVLYDNSYHLKDLIITNSHELNYAKGVGVTPGLEPLI